MPLEKMASKYGTGKGSQKTLEARLGAMAEGYQRNELPLGKLDLQGTPQNTESKNSGIQGYWRLALYVSMSFWRNIC